MTGALHQWLPLTHATVDTVSGVSHTGRRVPLAVSRPAASMTQYGAEEQPTGLTPQDGEGVELASTAAISISCVCHTVDTHRVDG